jgi:hypothetical protein
MFYTDMFGNEYSKSERPQNAHTHPVWVENGWSTHEKVGDDWLTFSYPTREQAKKAAIREISIAFRRIATAAI